MFAYILKFLKIGKKSGFKIDEPILKSKKILQTKTRRVSNNKDIVIPNRILDRPLMTNTNHHRVPSTNLAINNAQDLTK